MHEIGDGARALVCKFWEANKQDQRDHVCRPQLRWSPPTVGTYKANFDAALFGVSECAVIGVVFRDHSGHVIAAESEGWSNPDCGNA